MASVEDHYEALLARHYTWMRGGYDSRVRENRAFFEETEILPEKGGKALDLGCGPGFQSVALAGLGFEVVSVDSSEILLRELEDRAGTDLSIRPVPGDMRDPGAYAEHGPFEVAVCMGDTLTHLRSKEEAASLIRAVRDALEEGGRLILQFRDLTHELEGADRAIPVRTDEERIMATFLEYEPEHVNVHDMIFVKGPSGWKMEKSAYKKVRLGTKEVEDMMERAGFEVVERKENEGFATIIGVRVAPPVGSAPPPAPVFLEEWRNGGGGGVGKKPRVAMPAVPSPPFEPGESASGGEGEAFCDETVGGCPPPYSPLPTPGER